MKLLLKFEMEDIRLAFTTRCYTPVWQIEGEYQNFGGQNCKELMYNSFSVAKSFRS